MNRWVKWTVCLLIGHQPHLSDDDHVVTCVRCGMRRMPYGWTDLVQPKRKDGGA